MSPQLVVTTAVKVLPAAVAWSGLATLVIADGGAGAAVQPSTGDVVVLLVLDVVGAAAGVVVSSPSCVVRKTKAATTTRTAATTTATCRLRAASRSLRACLASNFSARRRALARSCSLVTRASLGRVTP